MVATTALLALLAAATPTPGLAAPGPAVAATGVPDVVPIEVAGPAELETLCQALEPAERLRTKGDALDRATAEDTQEERRDLATVARYRVTIPAGKLFFGPYARGEGRLALQDAVLLGFGGARLYCATEAGLPVEADLATAKRLFELQRKGELALELVFDLPDDATCSRGRPRTLAVEPVSWRWRAGEEVLALGGAAGADRTALSAARGAQARVTVGEPLSGPAAARKAIAARQDALGACYADALKRAPSLDGVLVAEVTGAGSAAPKLSGDSVGDAALATCVQKALAGVTAAGGPAAVPIRFELTARAP
ncbi:MAG: hypothetical protein QM704_23705 [Anaeromyxobacteraceae bacterium]